MPKVLRVLRGGTRNQSTADFSRENPFTYGNRYYETTVSNNTLAAVTLEDGVLVMRLPNGKTAPITAKDDLSKVIGIAAPNCEKVLEAGEEMNTNYTFQGEVDGGLLVLPEDATLNEVVGDRTLKDLLTSLGIIVVSVTEHTKFDN